MNNQINNTGDVRPQDLEYQVEYFSICDALDRTMRKTLRSIRDYFYPQSTLREIVVVKDVKIESSEEESPTAVTKRKSKLEANVTGKAKILADEEKRLGFLISKQLKAILKKEKGADIKELEDNIKKTSSTKFRKFLYIALIANGVGSAILIKYQFFVLYWQSLMMSNILLAKLTVATIDEANSPDDKAYIVVEKVDKAILPLVKYADDRIGFGSVKEYSRSIARMLTKISIPVAPLAVALVIDYAVFPQFAATKVLVGSLSLNFVGTITFRVFREVLQKAAGIRGGGD